VTLFLALPALADVPLGDANYPLVVEALDANSLPMVSPVFRVSKNGGTMAVDVNTWTAVTGSVGLWKNSLADANTTNTLGELAVEANAPTCTVREVSFFRVSNPHDANFGGLQANVSANSTALGLVQGEANANAINLASVLSLSNLVQGESNGLAVSILTRAMPDGNWITRSSQTSVTALGSPMQASAEPNITGPIHNEARAKDGNWTDLQATLAAFRIKYDSNFHDLQANEGSGGGGSTDGNQAWLALATRIWPANSMGAKVTGTALTLVSPIAASGSATVVVGDDYMAADGRALTWTISGYSGPAITSDGNVKFRAITLTKWAAASTAWDLEANAVVTQSGSNLSVSVSLPAALTGALSPSPPATVNQYHFQVSVTAANGSKAMIIEGSLTAKKKL
jgi:hypothetical protein